MKKTKAKRQRKIEGRINRRNKQREYNQKEWARGRIMKEERIEGEKYSPEYTAQLSIRLRDNIIEALNNTSGEENGLKQFLHFYRQTKNHIRDLLIFWNPAVDNLYLYNFLKQSLETYWDLREERKLELRDKIEKLYSNYLLYD